MRAFGLLACAVAFIVSFSSSLRPVCAQQRGIAAGNYFSVIEYRLKELEKKANEVGENARQQGNVAVGSSVAILEFRLKELERKVSESADNVKAQVNASASSSVANLEYKFADINEKLKQAERELKSHGDDILEYKTWFKSLALALGGAASLLALILAWWQVRRASVHREMLKRGEETISLVNNILALARESTESAMKSAEVRAKRELDVLDQAVNKLMSFGNTDNRDVILKREKNDELKELFHELTAFEYGNRSLDTPLPLTPACMFLKGLKYAQEHRFELAIEQWRATYSRPEAIPGVKLRTRYWIGFQQNNLGRFTDAEKSFDAAVGYANSKVANASDERRLELERLSVETRLYSMEGQQVGALLARIDAVLQECENKHFNEVMMAASRTKGNILYTIARGAFNLGDKAKAADYMRQAKALWKSLVDGDMEVNMAARREYAFACYALDEDLGEAEDLLKLKVREEARKQYTDCIGHKEKAYYAMIQLMVAKAQQVADRAQSMDTRANFHVAETHDLEFLFSPLRKRPVSRQDFQDDIKLVSENGLPAVAV